MPGPTMEDRIKAYKAVFKKFDMNGDNEIDLVEVCEALGMDPDDAKGNLTLNDVDGDGKISFNEFYLLIRNEQKKIETKKSEQDERWRSAFLSFDRDGNGTIGLEEFHKFWKAVEEDLTDNAIDLLFAAADLDASGAINYEEFSAVLNFVTEG